MKKLSIIFFAAALFYSCTSSPTQPGNETKGFIATTDSNSYSVGSAVSVTVVNKSPSVGLFSACGKSWDFMLQKQSGSNWVDYEGLVCLAIYPWLIAALPSEASHTLTLPALSLFPTQSAQGTYRFKFHFGVSPDSTLSDSLFSNMFTLH